MGAAVNEAPAPRETAGNRADRDELGRFAPGCAPGPGRPPAPDFRRVVAERLAANGGSVDAVLFEVFEALRAEAAAGNVAAAKLLLDRLAPDGKEGKAARSLDEIIGETINRSLTDDERADRIRAILSDAHNRAELDRQRPILRVTTGVVAPDEPWGNR